MSADDTITLAPCQSLALRKMIEALKADDSLYTACPDVVRLALCDMLLPPYSSAEKQILALQDESDSRLRLAEKFGFRIRTLEAQLSRRVPPCPVPLP